MKWFSAIIVVAFLITITEMTCAQPGLPSEPSQAPIDGGIALLAAMGGTYAFKKLRDKKD